MNNNFPFNSKAFGFSLENALSLAAAAKAAYTNDISVLKKTVETWGFDFNRLRWFDQGNTQAFLVADDEKMILAFRGTEPNVLGDWAADARIRMTPGPGGDVHRGFLAALHRIWADVEDAVEELRDKRQTFWVTGHSLGAALATLAVASFRFRETPVPVNGLYTFGQPRAGSEMFAEHFNAAFKKRTFRFVNNNDVVTRVPPSAFGYSHVGILKYFDNNGELHTDSELTWWDRFWDRIGGKLESYLHLKPGDGIRDHSMDDYRRLLEKALGR